MGHRTVSCVLVLATASAVASAAHPESAPPSDSDGADGQYIQSTLSPTEPANQVQSDLEPKENLLELHGLEDWDDWKVRLQKKTGLQIAADYTALGFWADENSIGEDRSSSGALRIYGRWDIIGNGTKNAGGIVFKLENRHAYSDVAVTDFGFELGYVGLLNPLLSDQGNRITHLHWRQAFNEGQSVLYGGWLDFTDYTDAYALASPWEDFSNLVFVTGAGAISTYPDGAFGFMAASFLTENLYASASIVDANADATDLMGGVDSFFEDFETLKTLELGYALSRDIVFLDNFHVTAWQIDERTEIGQPDGWGMNFSAAGVLGNHWFPFVRIGLSEDGGTLYEASVSTGFGFKPSNSIGFFGFGFNWAKPNENTFGAELNDQYTFETYYRLQLSQRIQLTPSLQYLVDPALNPEDSSILVFGLRARVAF